MRHEAIEKSIGLMMVLIVVVISFGGLAEIVPLFFQEQTTQPAENLKPWSALQLEGRDVYIREGCNVCHTQMVRPLQAEVQRYGHQSTAPEGVYEHPFLWGSKRTGPDLARVGGKYSDAWHRVHLNNPRDVVPESNMPAYPWLAEAKLNGRHTADKMRALKLVGVPYSEDDMAYAESKVYGKTELEAVVAYLQGLGLVKRQQR